MSVRKAKSEMLVAPVDSAYEVNFHAFRSPKKCPSAHFRSVSYSTGDLRDQPFWYYSLTVQLLTPSGEPHVRSCERGALARMAYALAPKRISTYFEHAGHWLPKAQTTVSHQTITFLIK